MIVAWLALFIALGSAAFATSNTIDAKIQPHHVRGDTPRTSSAWGSVVAYALVEPTTCDVCSPGASPGLDVVPNRNVSLGLPKATAQTGNWYFKLGDGIDQSKATVLVSAEGAETREVGVAEPTSIAKRAMGG